MLYPSITQYKQAVCDADYFNRLKNGIEAVIVDKQPVFASGNFAVVFKMKYKGKFYALKCFTKDIEKREERLLKITEYIKQNKSPYFIEYQYLKNELWLDINGGAEYPVSWMQWVEAETLGEKIKKYCEAKNKTALKKLLQKFNEMAYWLLNQDFAHGDLKHDNILVLSNGNLKLVDYDGMYIPEFNGGKAYELGGKAYQHPLRDANFFNRNIDDFSILIINISLEALAENPELYTKYNNGQNITFSLQDFEASQKSELFFDIRLINNPDLYEKIAYLDYYLIDKSINIKPHILFTENEIVLIKSLSKIIENEATTGTFTDHRDGQTYKWVKIGEQIWMAENLNYNTKDVTCAYDYDEENTKKYGRLYDWNEAKRVCPPGWHLPSDDEWTQLSDFLGGADGAGGKLKAKTGWNNNGNGTDDLGFTALPGGYYSFYGGFFSNIGHYGHWWSATENKEDDAWKCHLSADDKALHQYCEYKIHQFSVRCLRDNEVTGTFIDPRDGQTYKWVKIGEQIWMAENLNYKTQNGSWAYDEKKYGRLYNWETAKKSCPPGWHLPSDDEWKQLSDFLGGEDVAGKYLKAQTGWNNNGNGTDDFGFSALPGGCLNNGSFGKVGRISCWWSSTEYDTDFAWNRGMSCSISNVGSCNNGKSYGFSVRCLRD